MTAFQQRIMEALGEEWRSAQQIINRMPLAYRYGSGAVTPHLGKFTRDGVVECNRDQRWWRWRLKV